MRFLNIFLLMILLSSSLFAQDQVISEKQDEFNRKYLIQLNNNLLSTIDMLQVFNEKGQEIYLIKQGELYNSFLLDLTMQCSNLIDKIRQAEVMSPLARELQIRALIATIKADVEYNSEEVPEAQQRENSNYLTNVEINLNAQTASVLQAMVKEEKLILEKGEVTTNYLRLHTHHFLFSLLEDFIQPSDYLSPANENYLVQIVQSVDASLQKN